MKTSARDPLSGLAVGPAPAVRALPSEQVVQIEAAALNHHDLWTLRGLVGVRLPRVLGSDGAGAGRVLYPVMGCGDTAACRGCSAGDVHLCRRMSTLGEAVDGTLAPWVAVPTTHIVDAPANLTVEEAACLPSAYLTAYRMLFTVGGLGSGDTVLVTGATGGVGVAALQLGAAAGLRMVAQVRNESVASTLEDLGAACVVGADRDVKTVLGREVDAVIESVGKATWQNSLRAVRPGGTVLVTGATSGDPPADLRRIFWRQLRVLGVSLGSREDMRRLVEFVEERQVKPRIAAVYPVEEARAAFERLAAGQVLGKVVVRLRQV
jgi:NADPH:quinone reductase-like Zn-dependent oxidoreductase